MSTKEIIEELKALPAEELEKVRQFLDKIADTEIPETFWQGLREADDGKLIDMRDEHFDNPPA